MIRKRAAHLLVIALGILLVIGVGAALAQTRAQPAPAGRPLPCEWRDDFDGPALDPRWSWVREDITHWSLSALPGSLRITTQPGSIHFAANDAENLLLQTIPHADFTIETRLEFTPTQNFQTAGLLVYEDDDHFVFLTRGFCGQPACVGDGLYFNYEREGAAGSPTLQAATPAPGPLYLRLERRGVVYTAYWSPDGSAWARLGAHTANADFAPTQIGLAAFHGPDGAAHIPADFDFFASSVGCRTVYQPLQALRRANPEAPDVIYYHGHILTVQPDSAYSAIAIRGDRVVALGSDEQILALAGPHTQLIHLTGTMIPGMHDGHTHVLRHAAGAGRTLDEAISLALSFGLTSVTEMSGDVGFIEELQAAESEGRLRLRVNVFPSYNAARLDEQGKWIFLGEWYPDHAPILDPERRLRVPGVKIYADGAGVGSRGCPAMTIPYPYAYTDPGFWSHCFDERGDLYLSQAELDAAVADLQGRGYRVAFHTMGDRGIDTVLNAIEAARAGELQGESDGAGRHQIQHNSFLRDDQFARYTALDVLASVRGTWNTCDQDEYVDNWPDHYAQWTNRFGLPAYGVHAYGEGDFGWGRDPYDQTAFTTVNPLMIMWGLVTRQQLLPDGGACAPDPWVARHPISSTTALRMLTYEPAYAVSMEDHLGSIAPGHFADLVILGANPVSLPPNAIRHDPVWMTMVVGTVEYCAPGHEELCPGVGSATPTATSTVAGTPTGTATPSDMPPASATPTHTATPTGVAPATSTRTPTRTSTPTATSTSFMTPTPTATLHHSLTCSGLPESSSFEGKEGETLTFRVYALDTWCDLDYVEWDRGLLYVPTRTPLWGCNDTALYQTVCSNAPLASHQLTARVRDYVWNTCTIFWSWSCATPTPTNTPTPTATPDVYIAALVPTGGDEYVLIHNGGPGSQTMTGWRIYAVGAGQYYNFPAGYSLAAGNSVAIHSGPHAMEILPSHLKWTSSYIWNDLHDQAGLLDAWNNLRSSWSY